MCPTVVTREGAVVLTVGATGGRRIVNALANVLASRIGENKPLPEAVKGLRIHTEGDLALVADRQPASKELLTKRGYTISLNSIVTLHGIERLAGGGLQTEAR